MTEVVQEAASWIYKIIFTLLIALVAIFLVNLVTSSEINTAVLQGDLLRNRILFDPGGIWLVENGVFYPGIISMEAFNDQERMNAAFVYPDRYGGARLTLLDQGQGYERYINKEPFTYIEEQLKAGAKNVGFVQVHTYPVVIAEGSERRNGYLIVEVAMPVRA